MNETPNSPEAASLPAAEQIITPALEGAILQAGAPLVTRILSDAAGNPSSMRLLMLLSWLAVMAPWVVISIQTRQLQPLPESIVTLLAIPVGGKLWQKYKEPAALPPLYKISTPDDGQLTNGAAVASAAAPNPPAASIHVGDVVRLNSGGPDMTVSQITDNLAHCEWDGRAAVFALPCLTLVSASSSLYSGANVVQGDPAQGSVSTSISTATQQQNENQSAEQPGAAATALAAAPIPSEVPAQ